MTASGFRGPSEEIASVGAAHGRRAIVQFMQEETDCAIACLENARSIIDLLSSRYKRRAISYCGEKMADLCCVCAGRLPFRMSDCGDYRSPSSLLFDLLGQERQPSVRSSLGFTCLRMYT